MDVKQHLKKIESEPRSDLKREMELGSHSELNCLLFQVPTAGLSDFVKVTLFPAAQCQKSKLRCSVQLSKEQFAMFPTAVKRASCDVPHSCQKGKLRSTVDALHWRGPHLLNSYCSGGG